MKTTPCRECARPMRMIKTDKGGTVPLDPDPVANGNIIIRAGVMSDEDDVASYLTKAEAETETAPRYKSHFATCTNPARFRKTKKNPTRA